MIGLINPYLIGGLLVFLATTGTGGYLYYQTTQTTIRELQKQNTRYETQQKQLTETLEQNQIVYQQLLEQKQLQEQRENELQIKLKLAEQYSNKLVGKLRSHDLTYLSLSKPGLIEKRINDGTEQVLDNIESITRD
jgi:succinate dehydrogenase/fumarate reductase flavoprotein subunit